ncbi:MAG: helix-turn-helix domain-containing protein [Enterobacterales bacterium]|nr:helix-turn-helix domain-containing protein [Enterobacterales bacterium]
MNKGSKLDCGDECPVKLTADIIEGKWMTLVIRELLPSKKRYSEIQRALVGISPKVLTTRLRFLQEKKNYHANGISDDTTDNGI